MFLFQIPPAGFNLFGDKTDLSIKPLDAFSQAAQAVDVVIQSVQVDHQHLMDYRDADNLNAEAKAGLSVL